MATKHRARVQYAKRRSGAQKGDWYFTVKGANGEIQITSEGYTSKRDAERGFKDLVASIISAFDTT